MNNDDPVITNSAAVNNLTHGAAWSSSITLSEQFNRIIKLLEEIKERMGAPKEECSDDLTTAQIQRQDFVDNTIHAMLCDLAGDDKLKWDIGHISTVRNIVENIVCNELTAMTPYEFYPWIEGDKEPL